MKLVFFAFERIEKPADEVEDNLALAGGQLADGRPEPYAAARVFPEIAQPRAILRLGPRIHRAVFDRERPIGDHAVHIVIHGVAETLASGARPGGRVKAEQNRLRLAELQAACLALELL